MVTFLTLIFCLSMYAERHGNVPFAYISFLHLQGNLPLYPIPSHESSLFIHRIILPLASPTVCLNNYPGLLQSNPSHNNQPNRRVLEIRRSERFSGLTPEEIPRRYVASRRASRFHRVMEVAYAPDVAPYKRALPHYQCSTSTSPVW